MLELVSCGDLYEDIVKEIKYTEEKARSVFLQILKGTVTILITVLWGLAYIYTYLWNSCVVLA